MTKETLAETEKSVDELLELLKAELRALILASPKTREQVMGELGLSVNYLDSAWRRKNLKLRTLFLILEVLGVTPLSFLAGAIRQPVEYEPEGEEIKTPATVLAEQRFDEEFNL